MSTALHDSALATQETMRLRIEELEAADNDDLRAGVIKRLRTIVEAQANELVHLRWSLQRAINGQSI